MEKHESADRRATGVLHGPAEAAGDSWLDRALEDTFPASDPVASNLFD